jgi:uncharacterized membrane protein YwaF
MKRVPVVIVALAALLLLYVRLLSEQTAQSKTLATFGILLLASLLLLSWLLVASGYSRRVRLGVLGAVIAALAASCRWCACAA